MRIFICLCVYLCVCSFLEFVCEFVCVCGCSFLACECVGVEGSLGKGRVWGTLWGTWSQVDTSAPPSLPSLNGRGSSQPPPHHHPVLPLLASLLLRRPVSQGNLTIYTRVHLTMGLGGRVAPGHGHGEEAQPPVTRALSASAQGPALPTALICLQTPSSIPPNRGA